MTTINYALLCETVTQCTGGAAGVLENPLFEIFVSFSYQIPCCSFPVILFLFFLSIVLRVLCLTVLFYCWLCAFCYLVSAFVGSPTCLSLSCVLQASFFFSVMPSFALLFFLFLPIVSYNTEKQILFVGILLHGVMWFSFSLQHRCTVCTVHFGSKDPKHMSRGVPRLMAVKTVKVPEQFFENSADLFLRYRLIHIELVSFFSSFQIIQYFYLFSKSKSSPKWQLI